MGLRLRQKSLFLAYVLAPLCAISNFNYEQVNPRNFPAAMLLHGRLSFRKPVLPSPSSGLVHRAFPIIYYIDFKVSVGKNKHDSGAANNFVRVIVTYVVVSFT